MSAAAIRVNNREASSRLALAIASSVLIHVALLAASPMLRLGSAAPSPILRVSLIASPGSRGGGGAVGAAPAPAARTADRVESRAPQQKPVARKSEPARPKSRPAPAKIAALPARPAEDVASIPSAAAIPRADDGGPASQPAGGNGSSPDGKGNGGDSTAGSGSGHGAGGGVGDLRVACEYCPTPRYPRTAVARKVEGIVQVGFTLTSDGRVSEVEVRSSSGDHELDRAAVDVARRSRFRLSAPLADASPGRGYLEYQFQLARRGNT